MPPQLTQNGAQNGNRNRNKGAIKGIPSPSTKKYPKWSQNAPKMEAKWTQTGAKWRQMEPQGRHKEPKGIWEGPRKPKGSQNGANGGAKRIFNWFLMEFHCIFNWFSLIFNVFNRISLHVRLIFFKLVSNVPWVSFGSLPSPPRTFAEPEVKPEHTHTQAICITTPRFPFHVLTGSLLRAFLVTFSLPFLVLFFEGFFT